MILYAIRAVWIAAHVLVLIRGQELQSRYRFFAAYMLLSTMLSAAYWPELLPGWDIEFADWMVAALLLRTLACLEALHHQTREFPRWSRLMGSAFLMGAGVLLLLAGVRDNQWAGLLVEYRRYLQIWTMVVMLVVQLSLLERGWWRRRGRDWHAIILFGIAANHGLISWWCMAKHPVAGSWMDLNSVSIAADAALYLAWALALSHGTEKGRGLIRRSPPLHVAGS